ncbi:transposase [Cypionkella psychrotolerans]
MKTSRYTEPQILAILGQAEGGMPVAELCRVHGMMPLPGNRSNPASG